MREWLGAALLLVAGAAQAQNDVRPARDTANGAQPVRDAMHDQAPPTRAAERHAGRPDDWNTDGAPRPPRQWRGRGGHAWPQHYKACRARYGRRYDYHTDLIRGRHLNCRL